jgi:hypothetical protein
MLVTIEPDPREAPAVTAARARDEELGRNVAGETFVATVNGAERVCTREAYLAEQIDGLWRLLDERKRRVAALEHYLGLPRGVQAPHVRQYVEEKRPPGRTARVATAVDGVS